MRKVGIRGLLLATAYALLYGVVRDLSVSHWLLTSGLRFVALLFLPYRLWPLILVGDVAGSAWFRAEKLHDYGAAWLLVSLLGPVIATALPVLALRHTRWDNDPIALGRPVTRMLLAGVAAAAFSSLAGVIALDAIHYSGGVTRVPGAVGHFFAMFTVGDFLGILVFAPITLTVLRGRWLRAIMDNDLHGLSFTGYIWSLCVCAMAWTFLLVTSRTSSFTEVQNLSRVLMLLPAVVMTCRHGWMGALPSVLMGNVLLQASMTQLRDNGLIEAQFVMAIVGASMLVLGALKTEGELRKARLDKENLRSQRLARSNLQWGETWAHQSAAILESASAMIVPTYEEVPVVDGTSALARAQSRWAQTGALRMKLEKHIESLRLSAVRVYGVKTAIHSGPFRQTLEEAGISVRVRVSPTSTPLASDLAHMLYRLAEGFSLRLARDFKAGRIRIRIVIGRDARRSVAIVVKAVPGMKAPQNLPLPYFSSIEARNIAQTYQGIYNDGTAKGRPVISILLRDTI